MFVVRLSGSSRFLRLHADARVAPGTICRQFGTHDRVPRIVNSTHIPTFRDRGREVTEFPESSQGAFLDRLAAGRLREGETLEQLFASFYDELHRVARRELRRGFGAALGPSTLLHETFLNIQHRELVKFTDHRQFISYAASAMRGIIVDHFRNRSSQKRGGMLKITSLPT